MLEIWYSIKSMIFQKIDMSAFINFSFASLTSKIEFSLYFLEEIKKKNKEKIVHPFRN